MKVEFLEDWRGSKAGDIIELNDEFCKLDLIPRKIVKPVNTSDQDKIKKQAEELAGLKKKLKQVNAAPVDKQLKGAAKTK